MGSSLLDPEGPFKVSDSLLLAWLPGTAILKPVKSLQLGSWQS